jgi:hypothetical protein
VLECVSHSSCSPSCQICFIKSPNTLLLCLNYQLSFFYSFIHMCIHCLGHLFPLPPSPSLSPATLLASGRTCSQLSFKYNKNLILNTILGIWERWTGIPLILRTKQECVFSSLLCDIELSSYSVQYARKQKKEHR